MSDTSAHFEKVVDAIEGGYEFLLAYAAQGRHTDRGVSTELGPRPRLESMVGALVELPHLARELAASAGVDPSGEGAAFFDAMDRDASVSAAAIALVLAAPDIGSQLIDNLNASIHLRALLTDLFLLDEALKR